MRLLRACFGQPFNEDEQLRQRTQPSCASHSSCGATPAASPRGTARAHGPPQHLVFCSQLLAAVDAAPYAVTVLSDVDADGRVHVLSQNERSRWYFGPRDAGAPAGAKRGDLLKELFQVEGDQELQAMLEAVLHGNQQAWRKTMRVPASCVTGALAPAHSLATTSDLARQLAPIQTQVPAQAPRLPVHHMALDVQGVAPRSHTLPSVASAQLHEMPPCLGHISYQDAAPMWGPCSLGSHGHGMTDGMSGSPRSVSTVLEPAAAASAGATGAPKRLKSLISLASGSGSPMARSYRSSKSWRRLSAVMPVSFKSTVSISEAGRATSTPASSMDVQRRSGETSGQGDASFVAPDDVSLAHLTEFGGGHETGNAVSGAQGDKCERRSVQPRTSRLCRGHSAREEASNPTFDWCRDSAVAGPAWQSSQITDVQLYEHFVSSGLKWPGEQEVVWHELHITKSTNTLDGRPVLMVYQSDVTQRTTLETALAKLTEIQLGMLCQIFPRHVLEAMSTTGGTMGTGDLAGMARSHNDVSILFMDICGFTDMSKQVAPQVVMSFLNELFSLFDTLCSVHRCHKIETAGDCYIVSSGLLSMDNDEFYAVREEHDPQESAARLLAFAYDMLRASRQVTLPHDGSPVRIRIGVHSGPCVSGIVGSKLPKFGVFGDTMNTASRMESTCTPGRIQISAATHTLLMGSGASSAAEWLPTGGIEVKGKGRMETYLWREIAPSAAVPSVVLPHGSWDAAGDDTDAPPGQCGADAAGPTLAGVSLRVAPLAARHSNLLGLDLHTVTALLHVLSSSIESQQSGGPAPANAAAAAETAGAPDVVASSGHNALVSVTVSQALRAWGGVDRSMSRDWGQSNSFAQLLLPS